MLVTVPWHFDGDVRVADVPDVGSIRARSMTDLRDRVYEALRDIHGDEWSIEWREDKAASNRRPRRG